MDIIVVMAFYRFCLAVLPQTNRKRYRLNLLVTFVSLDIIDSARELMERVLVDNVVSTAPYSYIAEIFVSLKPFQAILDHFAQG